VGLAGGGLLSLLIFLVFWLGGDLFFAKMGNSSLIFITGVVAALLTWVEQIDNIFSSALRGAEKFGYAASLEIVGKTTQMLFAVFAVWIWGGLGVLYTALLLGAFLKLISKAYFVIKIFSLKSLCPSFNSAHALVHNAKWGWLQGMGGLFFGVADRMLVGSFLGASSLAHYSIATQLAQQIHALCAASFSVIFPKVSRKLEGDKNFSLWRITKFLVVANFVIGTFLGLLLLIFGKKIMVLWLGQIEAEACADVLLYLIIAYWILAINVVPYYLLLSLGKVRFIGQVCIISGLLSIFTMYLAMQNYGLIGAALGRVVYATFTLSLIYPLMQHLRHHRKISLRI
jgi:O-antigen/teichoic acid export membrane protein